MNREILNLVQEGNLLIAIKLYKDCYHVNLLEAEDAIFSIKKEVNYLNCTVNHQSDSPYDYSTIQDRVLTFLRRGDRPTALQFYREALNVSLSEARRAINSFERSCAL